LGESCLTPSPGLNGFMSMKLRRLSLFGTQRSTICSQLPPSLTQPVPLLQPPREQDESRGEPRATHPLSPFTSLPSQWTSFQFWHKADEPILFARGGTWPSLVSPFLPLLQDVKRKGLEQPFVLPAKIAERWFQVARWLARTSTLI